MGSKINHIKSLLLNKQLIPTKIIMNLKEVAEYSFIVQKSVTYLDLSLAEFSRFKRKMQKRNYMPARNLFSKTNDVKSAILTEESFRKSIAPDRKLLYKFHLDVSKELEFSLRNASDKEIRPFHSSSILINNIVLKANIFETKFNFMLSEALKKHQKVKLIHFVCKMAKSMKFILKNKCIREKGLSMLCFQGADSTIVVDFLTTIDFQDRDLLFLFIDVFEFVLYQANQARFNLWKLNHCEMINASIFHCMFVKTESLLQYRDAPIFCTRLYNATKERRNSYGLLKEGSECPVENGLITKERHFLILQIFDVFCADRCIGLKALQMLWRSIPDPFITMDDVISVFFEYRNTKFIEELCNFIEKITGEEVKQERKRQPRELKHYCRLVIRTALSNNFQLSKGIRDLNLPSSLEDFLKLKC